MGVLKFLQNILGTPQSTPWAQRVGPNSRSPGAAQYACAGMGRGDVHGEDMKVYDKHGEPRRLGNIIGKGGEGRVYQLADNPNVLVKVYFPSVRANERGAMIREKLETMISFDKMKEDRRFGWPRILVFDGKGQWIGYAMRRVEGVMMQTLCQPQLVRERIPHWTRREVVRCAANFVGLVRFAHSRNIILGDINPANFLIDPRTCEVRAIDCDSYQVQVDGRFFPCPVGIPMLMAPELLATDYSTVRRTVQQELFSVAIMLFRMFMLGLHPYSRTYGSDPIQNLKSGCCALGRGSGYRFPHGPWYNIWSHLPYSMKKLFVRTFRDGHADPSKRVSLDEWFEALSRYQSDIDKGWFDVSLIPREPKSSKYKGKRRVSE